MSSQCDICGNLMYDDEEEYWFCAAGSMDEDDYARMMQSDGRHDSCPYYISDDEYKIVRKQM